MSDSGATVSLSRYGEVGSTCSRQSTVQTKGQLPDKLEVIHYTIWYTAYPPVDW